MKNAARMRALALVLALALPSSLRAQARGPAPDPAIAEILARDPFPDSGSSSDDEPVLSDLAFAELALVASGLPLRDRPSYLSSLASGVEALLAGLPPGLEGAARAEAILKAMHERMLGAYRLDASGLDLLLDKGLFNCVSSSILYAYILKRAGMAGYASSAPDHVLFVVSLAEGDVDVETTNPEGFDPGTKKEFRDRFGKLTGYSYVPPGRYSERKRVGEREHIAMIVSNRVVELEAKKRYLEALSLAADYRALVRGEEGLSFFADRAWNLVSFYLAAGRIPEAREALDGAALAGLPAYREAALRQAILLGELSLAAKRKDWAGGARLALLALGSGAADPEILRFLEAATMNEALDLARAGLYARARELAASRAGLVPRTAAEALLAIARTELSSLLGTSPTPPFPELLAACLRLRSYLEGKEFADAIVFIYSREAAERAKTEGWLAAAAFAEGAQAIIGADPRVARTATVLRLNFVAEAHNAFARLYNAGRYAEALAAIEGALALMPSDPELERDRAAVLAALGKD